MATRNHQPAAVHRVGPLRDRGARGTCRGLPPPAQPEGRSGPHVPHPLERVHRGARAGREGEEGGRRGRRRGHPRGGPGRRTPRPSNPLASQSGPGSGRDGRPPPKPDASDAPLDSPRCAVHATGPGRHPGALLRPAAASHRWPQSVSARHVGARWRPWANVVEMGLCGGRRPGRSRAPGWAPGPVAWTAQRGLSGNVVAVWFGGGGPSRPGPGPLWLACGLLAEAAGSWSTAGAAGGRPRRPHASPSRPARGPRCYALQWVLRVRARPSFWLGWRGGRARQVRAPRSRSAPSRCTAAGWWFPRLHGDGSFAHRRHPGVASDIHHSGASEMQGGDH